MVQSGCFTASVQAYADPMIDWLEKDRKYFVQRYYRHHCTQTPMGYVKDLGLVDPELSNVLIIDNSPISYCHNQSNGVGIEGWINDPSDTSLMALIPFCLLLDSQLMFAPFLVLNLVIEHLALNYTQIQQFQRHLTYNASSSAYPSIYYFFGISILRFLSFPALFSFSVIILSLSILSFISI